MVKGLSSGLGSVRTQLRLGSSRKMQLISGDYATKTSRDGVHKRCQQSLQEDSDIERDLMRKERTRIKRIRVQR